MVLILILINLKIKYKWKDKSLNYAINPVIKWEIQSNLRQKILLIQHNCLFLWKLFLKLSFNEEFWHNGISY